MNRTRWIVAGLAVTAVAAGVVSFFVTHERVKKEVREPPSGEARKNPYYALEHFLGEMGVEATTEQQVEAPTDTADAPSIYVLLDDQQDYTAKQVDRWKEWVEDGGQVVLPAPPVGQKRSTLLEALNFHHPESSLEPGASAETGGEEGPSTTRTYELEFSSLSIADWKSSAADWRAENAEGARVASSAPVREGRVTVLSDVELFRNEALDRAEHPRFAWESITLDAPENPSVTIVRFSTEQGWMGYAVAQTWPFLAVLGVLLLFALNAGRWQFGPERPRPPSKRRSRVEHIRATGEFLWDHEAATRLLEASRAALLDALARRRPSIRDLPVREQRRIVEEELEIDDGARMIFDDRDHLSEAQFQKRIELMERYRRTL